MSHNSDEPWCFLFLLGGYVYFDSSLNCIGMNAVTVTETDFKFRFFGGKFIELVFNSFDDVRVFSGEKGGNVGSG